MCMCNTLIVDVDADQRRPLGRYSSLADYKPRSLVRRRPTCTGVSEHVLACGEPVSAPSSVRSHQNVCQYSTVAGWHNETSFSEATLLWISC
jgi:hypothetical protein